MAESVLVELKATIADFQAKMGEARAELSKLDQAHASTASKMSAGFVGAVASIGVLGGAVVSAVKDYGDFEQAHVKLETAVKNTGHSFDDYQKQVDALDDHFHTFGYTQQQTEDALADLTTAVQNPTKAMQLMGLAADIAKFKNVDLATASDIVAKASEGNTKALKQMGIDLPIASTNAEKLKVAQEALKTAQDKLTEAQQKGGVSAATEQRNKIAQEQATVSLQAAEKALTDARAKGASPQEISTLTERLTIAQQRLAQATGALNAPTGNLATLTANVATAQQKVNDAASAGTDIIGQLSTMVGGQASAAAGTFDGKMKSAQATVHDFKVKVGKDVESVAADIINNLGDPNGKFQTGLDKLHTSWDNLHNHFEQTKLGQFLVDEFGFHLPIAEARFQAGCDRLRQSWDNLTQHFAETKGGELWDKLFGGGGHGRGVLGEVFHDVGASVGMDLGFAGNVLGTAGKAVGHLGSDVASVPWTQGPNQPQSTVTVNVTAFDPTDTAQKVQQEIAWHMPGLNVA